MRNGTLLSSRPVFLPPSVANILRRRLSVEEFQRLSAVQMQAITYSNDGLSIAGFLALPSQSQPEETFPALIYNRGGTGPRGALNPESAWLYAGLYASWGYIVCASNYRGQGESEGTEEWGGRDIDDALAQIELLHSLGNVDRDRVGLIGGSRGGMMALMMIRRSTAFRACVTVGAPTSLHVVDPNSHIVKTMSRFISTTDSFTSEAEKRSATAWSDELCKTTPLLVIHGSGDRRVDPEHAYLLGRALQKNLHPYKLVMFEEADHIMSGRKVESDAEIRSWVDHYVKNTSPLPRVGPHGA